MLSLLKKRQFWIEFVIWIGLLIGVYVVTQWRGSPMAVNAPPTTTEFNCPKPEWSAY